MVKKCTNLLLFFGVLIVVITIGNSSSQAADLKVNGWLGTKTAYSQRTGLGNIYPAKDMTGNQYTHMRGRIRFEFMPSEIGGIVWHNEIDFNYGDGTFENGRGRGGGLAADTVNLETKELYFHFAVPDTRLKAKIGVAGVADDFNNIILGADTAGFTLDYLNPAINLRIGKYRFWDQDISSVTDNVDFYKITASRELASKSRAGIAAYWLKDRGTGGNGALNQSGGDTRNIDGLAYLSNNSATSNAAIIASNQVYDLNSYFFGFFGKTQILENLIIDGCGVYNNGSVDVENSADIDISAIAIDLRAETEFGNTSVSLEGLYVSGSGKDTNQEFGFTNAGLYSAGANFYNRHGMMILLPDKNDFNYSSAYSYNVSNIYEDRFLGVTGLFGNANFTLPAGFGSKIGLGVLLSSEKRAVNGNTFMGTEINGELSYKIAPNVSAALRGAYAMTGDFYEVSSVEAAASTKGVSANSDPDDILYSYLQLKMSF